MADLPAFGGVDFWRLSEELSQFWTLRKDEDDEHKHILSLSMRGGMINAHDGTDELPVFLQYTAGGTDSIRGFTYASIGPKEGDVVIGGRAIFLNTLEYTYPI